MLQTNNSSEGQGIYCRKKGLYCAADTDKMKSFSAIDRIQGKRKDIKKYIIKKCKKTSVKQENNKKYKKKIT